jgi:Skp family chaperone for outer membrane proteins
MTVVLPVRGELPAEGHMIYQPGVLAAATVGFVSTGSGVSTSNRIRRFVAAPESALAIDWEKATTLEATLEELDRQPYSEAAFADVPPAMAKVASYRSWGTDFSDWAFRTQAMEVMKSPTFKATSNPGESEDDFRGRLQAAAEDKKKTAVDALQKQYDAKKATVETKVLKAEQAKSREAEQSRGRKMQTAISFGATVLSVLVGSKKFGTGTLGRATTTMRDVGRSIDEGDDVKRADENLSVAKQKLSDLETELQAEIAALEAGLDPKTEALDKVIVRPRKSDINVDALGLVWMPYWKDASGALTGAWG